MVNSPADPLELPAGFNSELGVPSRVEDTGTYHTTYVAARFAYALASNGAKRDLEILQRTINTLTQKCQELNPADPHRGNFRWELEDAAVEDLNAVHFVMVQLIPILLRFADRLSEDSIEKILQSTRMALEEIERIDVGLDYTNIALKDVTNTILGGELLDDGHYIRRGKKKLWDWLSFTYKSGGVTEINSPVYTNLVVEVIGLLSRLTRDEEVATLSRLISSRLGLAYALRIHPETGRLAGPFCRCYRPQLLGEAGPERDFLRHSVAKDELPSWIEKTLGSLPRPGTLLEGYDQEKGLYYSSHISNSFSMGVATRELISQENRYIAGQSNVFTVNFTCSQQDLGGLVFTRYIMNENWLGDFRPTPARTAHGLLLDEGRFFGVASENRAIGIYSPKFMGAWQTCSAAKLVFVIHKKAYVRDLLANGEPVNVFPHALKENALIVIGFDESFLAIRLFDRTDLGVNAPIRLVEREEELLLEVYNYKGPEKTFWELANPGSFYTGQPKCAFYAECVERNQFADIKEFSDAVASGNFLDETDPMPGYHTRNKNRNWKLGYSRDEQSTGISIDLMQWHLNSRWDEKGELEYPLLKSRIATQAAGGILNADGASLNCGQAKMWFYGNRELDLWVAGGISDRDSELVFEIHGKCFKVQQFRFGIIKFEQSEVSMDTNPEASLIRADQD